MKPKCVSLPINKSNYYDNALVLYFINARVSFPNNLTKNQRIIFDNRPKNMLELTCFHIIKNPITSVISVKIYFYIRKIIKCSYILVNWIQFMNIKSFSRLYFVEIMNKKLKIKQLYY